MYRAFQGANGWYVAWEDSQGYHHQPRDGGDMEEQAARAHADTLNDRALDDDEDLDDDQ